MRYQRLKYFLQVSRAEKRGPAYFEAWHDGDSHGKRGRKSRGAR